LGTHTGIDPLAQPRSLPKAVTELGTVGRPIENQKRSGMEANFTVAKDNFEIPGRFAATIECADDLMPEEIIERALRLGVGLDGWRFQGLADSARATGKPGLGRIFEVQARQDGRFFRNCGSHGPIT
jgi:hypothetical protein